MNEAAYISIICGLLGGEPETRHHYAFGENPRGTSYIKVDCETKSQVIEVGLDKRSSLDSLQQALFAAHLTDKEPVIAIVDTDEKNGRWEARITAAVLSISEPEVKVVVLSAAALKRGELNPPRWASE